MKVTVDMSMCTGHSRCYTRAPAVFASDENGQSVVKVADVPPELERRPGRPRPAASNGRSR
jgi:ferredoxin